MSDTLLKLIGMGIAPWSARGLTQTIEPIGSATQLRRTINGKLKDISDPMFRKYQSTISATDLAPPALEGVMPGMQLVVHCVKEFVIQGTIGSGTTDDNTTEQETEFSRPAVPGSIRHEEGFTYYRPILTMLVTGLSESQDEWAASLDWSINLEEV